MDQLIGRTYRRGQTHAVTVIFFLLESSIDERMHALAAGKMAVASSLLGESATVTRVGPDGDLMATAEGTEGALDTTHLPEATLLSG